MAYDDDYLTDPATRHLIPNPATRQPRLCGECRYNDGCEKIRDCWPDKKHWEAVKHD